MNLCAQPSSLYGTSSSGADTRLSPNIGSLSSTSYNQEYDMKNDIDCGDSNEDNCIR